MSPDDGLGTITKTRRNGPGKRVGLVVLGAVLVIGAASLTWLLVPVLDGVYAPVWTDEYAYCSNARSFSQTGALAATMLFEEQTSLVGAFDAHGPAYTLVNGFVVRVFGVHALNMILTNLVFLGLAVALLLVCLPSVRTKAVVAGSLLLYFTVPIYLFTYMQETMQLLFGVVVALLLYGVSQSRDGRSKAVRIGVYLAVLATMCLFRPTWALCTAGLLPLAENRRQRLLFGGVFVAGILAALVYSRCFLAPFPYGFIAKVSTAVADGHFIEGARLVFGNLATNLKEFFFSLHNAGVPSGVTPAAYFGSGIVISYAGSKYLVALLALLCLWFGWRRRDRFAMAAGVIVALHLTVLLLGYDARDWREQRLLAPLVCLMVLALSSYKGIRVAVPVLLLVLFVPALRFTKNAIIPAHRNSAMTYRDSPVEVAAFAGIAEEIRDARATTILVSRAFYIEGGVPLLALPVRSAAGYPIRYTFNLSGRDLELYGPGFVDYVLMPCASQPGDSTSLPFRIMRVMW